MLILKIILHYIQRVEREQLRNKKQWMTRIHLQGVRYCFVILYLFWKIVDETQMSKPLEPTRHQNFIWMSIFLKKVVAWSITKQYRTPCMIKMLTWHLMFLCHLKSDVRTFLFTLAFFHKMQFSGHSITSKKRG